MSEPWNKRASDEDCIAAYERFGHLGQAAASLGIHKSTLHGRLVKLGVSASKNRPWGPGDDERLRKDYMRFRKAGMVGELAAQLGRTTGAVCTRAYGLGLTDANAGEDGAYVPGEPPARVAGDDRERVGRLLLALGARDTDMWITTLEGEPMSKARARFTGKGGVYTPPSVKEAEQRWVGRLQGMPKLTGNVALAAMFVRGNRQRIDVDNMLKLVGDACTRAEIWEDDSQVTGMAGLVELDRTQPRTILALAEHESTMLRGSAHWPICVTCGEKFNPAGRKRPKFCSRECRDDRTPPEIAA